MQMGFELVGQVMHVDHGRLDAGRGKAVEHMIDERPAGKRHERLRHARGQRAHPLAIACGEHHCRPRSRHSARPL
jgi:hypothetical protein